MTDLTVNVTRKINAPIEKVFDAWLDPKLLSQFILPMSGMPQPETKVDAKEGGEFSIIMQVGDEKIPHTGTYLDISRPNKLSFTWESPFSVDGSTVTLKFTEMDDDQTQVELSHVKFVDEEARGNHEGGWMNILQLLDEIVS